MLEKLLFLTLLVASCFCASHASAEDAAEPLRAEAQKLMKDGNFKEAAERFRTLAIDPGQTPKTAAKDLADGVLCFLRLGDVQNAAALLRNAEDVWKNNWRVALAIVSYRESTEALVQDDAGNPMKGYSLERVRVENIRRLLAAQAGLDDTASPAGHWEKKEFYAQLAKTISQGRQNRLAWRLTALTDLDVTPEIEEYHVRWTLPQRSAPVGADGNPIYYRMPESWEAAENDGQRWRWALGRMAALGGDVGRDEADMWLAQFLLGQFGVQTITLDSPLDDNAALAGETGPFAVRTLREDETIARLATGLKRFVMPAEFDHIAILRRLAASGFQRHQAEMALAQIFENRQQFGKAVSCYESLLRETGTYARESAEAALKRITGNNGMLEVGPVAPAGSRTSLSYLFRNGSKVAMTAKRLDEKKLLADIRKLIKTGSDDLYKQYYMREPAMLGRFVVEENLDRYLAETVASWDVTLSPLPDHYSSRTRIELPFDLAGCYLVETEMADGNTSRVVLWISDLALIRKNVGQQQILYVADAVGGEGVAATVTFSGFSQTFDDRTNRNILKPDEFAVKTDADGLAMVDMARVQDKEWLTIALTDDGRLAYLGFDRIWPMSVEWSPTLDERSFIITDRPAYRPGQDIHLKAWLAQPVYGKAAPSMAGKPVTVRVANPRGETIYDKTLTTDEYGGVADTLSLGATAPLGSYQIYTADIPGGVSFRLEEYKKPEFEVVLDAPDRAIQLGDTAQLKVRAKYYYGAPVTDGKVTYKILRTPFEQSWLPPWRWDWLYGSGAWRVNYDYSWYPGWNDWGRVGPRPSWMPFRFSQPEVVAEGEGTLDADGVFRITLDTAPAKELFGNQDHSYEITAEVTDKSRRTIVGSGKVVASRKPFAVSLWANRGFYAAGQEMRFDLRALLPLGGGVATTGTAVLNRISYDADGVPTETESGSWNVATDKSGSGDLRLMADVPGQYRLVCKLTDADGNAVEGATLLTIRGDAGDGDFRFSALELVPDRQDYRVGDTVRLAVNSENRNGVVLFLLRPERPDLRGTRPTPLRLENGSGIVDIPVGAADQPNFFCEAITVFGGRMYTQTREIFVPPADKTLNVRITPDKESYAPGAEAEYKVKVTDADGKPAAGQVVVSVYDKSVEYISGGSNVGDIRSAFWDWKRHYYSGAASSLNKSMYRAEKRGDVNWEPIGVFGGQEADWNDDAVYVNGKLNMTMRSRGEFAPPMPAALASGPVIQQVPAAAPIMADVSATTESALVRYAEAPAPMMKEQAVATGGGVFAGGEAPVTVRSEFADTAFWNAALVADADGNASFSFDMPENLTAWKARAWVMGHETRVGDGESEVETKKNVIVRPQAPRFLTQKDQVILSANLHNYLPRAKAARAELVLEGGLLEPADGVELSRHVQLAAGGEARVDWLVNARRPGEARIVMKLFTDEESDAAEIKLPVVVHGARRVENFGGVIRGEENEAVIRFRVPEERLPDQSRLVVTFSPSIASAMLEALPFLIEYPYGCTEQTLNRFLPVVTTRHFLERMGVSLADARSMIENAPVDAKSEEWKQTWGDPRGAKKMAPVFDDAELAAMVAAGVERLSAMQNADGGWGWFSGAGERSWPHTTAVVVHGLIAAKAGGAAIPMGLIDGGVNWLRAYRNEQIERLKLPEDDKNAKGRADNLDAFIHMILAGQERYSAEMRDFLYRDRLDLSLSALSMFGIALHREKATNALDMVLRNLRQYEERNDEFGTAWLRVSGAWWWWYNDDVETQAWYLQLLSLTDARGETASGVAKHLLRNRKNGSYWRSTRDTAYAIEALSAYAQASGEATPDMTVDVYLDGSRVMQRRLTAAELLADNRFVLEGLAVESGEHELRLVRTGSGNVYYGGGVDLFSLEDPIAKAGFELKVDRAFYKLIREDGTADMATSSGTAMAGKVERYRRERLSGPFDGDDAAKVKVEAGDLIEVELTVEAANDYEYLVFEDMKAAGLEAVELRSGYTANKLGAYVEYRDQKVVLFVRYLPKGVYTVAYRFRAEIPGAFSALPTFGGGMYATDLFANSDEMKMRITEKGVFE